LLPAYLQLCRLSHSTFALLLGKEKNIPQAGWLAAVFYVLCPLIALGLARISMMDSLLTLWFTLVVIGWIEGYRGNRKGYLLMAVAIALATMTKGIIGFCFPARDFGLAFNSS
jgi:4-amino-4-deoxy-L-arabinose transferase-like glycosyltransferase